MSPNPYETIVSNNNKNISIGALVGSDKYIATPSGFRLKTQEDIDLEEGWKIVNEIAPGWKD